MKDSLRQFIRTHAWARQLVDYMRALLGVPAALRLLVITHLPGRSGEFFRYRYWKKRLRYLGKDVRIDTGVYFQNPAYIDIDDNTWIDKNVSILAGLDASQREKVLLANPYFKGQPGVVHIGKNSHIGSGAILSGIDGGIFIADDFTSSAGCRIYAFSHHFRSMADPHNTSIGFGTMIPPERQCLIAGPVQIDCNCGLALNAIILPGVHLPEGCFVKINSVVKNQAFEHNALLAGDPAVQVSSRYKVTQ